MLRRNPIYSSLCLSLSGALVLCLCGCSIEQRLSALSTKIEASFADAREWDQLPIKTISWQQAMSMVQQNNIELKKLSSAIDRYERQGLSIYTDMIPGLSYYGYLTKSIGDLSGMATDDLNSNVNITFNLPTITNIPYRVYSARASTFSAMKSRELRERDLTSKLYSAVRSRELELKKRQLANLKPDLTEKERMLAESSQRLTDAAHWKNVADILGDYSARWNILPESMPRVKWNRYLPRFSKLSELSIARFAIRLEQARLSQYGVALQYLPTISTNLYSPSLFSSSGGTYEGAFLNGEDTKLNLNLSYTLDTRLSNWNQYLDRKADYENTCREVHASIMDHKHKLMQFKTSMQDYLSWRSYMNKRIEYLEESQPETAEAQIERDATVLDMRMELLSQESKAIESETAVILEYGLEP